MLSNSINANAKILQSQHLTLNLVNRVASPPPRVQFSNRTTVKLPLPLDISPSASCNAATLDSSGGTGSSSSVRIHKSKLMSSASSSTLTAGSETTGKVLSNGSKSFVPVLIRGHVVSHSCLAVLVGERVKNSKELSID